jgi:tRNA-specific adenosine deaminase 3
MCSATSKEEWEEQCKLWPTSYHPAHEYALTPTCDIMHFLGGIL